MTATVAPVLVRVTRGEFPESVHRGHVCVVRPDGRPVTSLGDPSVLCALRSSAKPFQLLPLVALGAADRFGFTEQELAVMAGSHAGTPAHTAVVASALRKAGLAVEDLGCGAHLPFDAAAAEALLRANLKPTALHNNCSGKHAGFLALARHLGAPTRDYLSPDHPAQRAVRESVAFAAGVNVDDVKTAVDGCSAPTFFLTMAAAARAFARLISAYPHAQDPREAAMGRIRRAMGAHPDMVAGDGRFDTLLMRAAPDIVAKGGAEAYQGLGWVAPDGPVGVAIKILDGGGRAVGPAALAVLEQLDVWTMGLPASLRPLARPVLTNHRGVEVGAVEAVLKLPDR